MELVEAASELSSYLTAVRHELHEHPELGLELPRTQALVLRELADLGLEITTGRALTSVVAVLRGTGVDRTGGEVPAVLLRADMDALPVAEEVDVEFKSKAPGLMHACGHDQHVTMLLGAVRLLVARKAELKGDVVFMFQPGEEGQGGARLMIEEGVLDAAGPRVRAAFGMHVFSAMLGHGEFTSRKHSMMAAADELHVSVEGRGGHGSAPHAAKDPVPVAAEMVTALHAMVTRKFDVFDPVVVTVGTFHAGTAANIIPDRAEFAATLRTLSPQSRALMKQETQRLVRGIAQAHGVEVEVDYQDGYPVTVNDPLSVDFVEQLVGELFGADRYREMPDPILGAEDFSYVLEQVPGAFVGLGAVAPTVDPATAAYNHSPRASYDDGVLPLGAALYAGLALRKLADLA